MIKIEVKWFAAYRDSSGIASEPIETASTSVAALFTEMTQRHTGLAELSRALVAINDEMVGWDAPIAEGDVVLFFPPVAGG